MQFIPDENYYPPFEQGKLHELKTLFRLWYEDTKQKALPTGYSAEDLIFDGFYPYYTRQSQKILFVGRESRDMEAKNYITALFDAYKRKRIGINPGQHINSNIFARRMFYIAYGIIAYGLKNEYPEWESIPWADEISDTFGTQTGISFSFMNISKFSNCGDSWQSNWNVINASCNLSHTGNKSFIAREIEILEPDIVISMNLGDKINFNCFGKVNEIESLPGKARPQVNAYNLNTEKKKNILLLDTYHFAAPGKKDLQDFYVPITQVINENRKNAVHNGQS